MAIFTMSDLHLSLDTNKSMEVFGPRWNNYVERIFENWSSSVKPEDTVIIGGDISWGMYLLECKKDFEFLNSLPGRKVLFKGNHDYWWESMAKMKAFATDNDFDTLTFMHNSALVSEDSLITGTRGWSLPDDSGFSDEDERIYKREILRLELSLRAGEELLKTNSFKPKRRICILHYPPFSKAGKADENLIALMKNYNVTHCFYGHLHSFSSKNVFEGELEDIRFKLVSADHLDFAPYEIT